MSAAVGAEVVQILRPRVPAFLLVVGVFAVVDRGGRELEPQRSELGLRRRHDRKHTVLFASRGILPVVVLLGPLDGVRALVTTSGDRMLNGLVRHDAVLRGAVRLARLIFVVPLRVEGAAVGPVVVEDDATEDLQRYPVSVFVARQQRGLLAVQHDGEHLPVNGERRDGHPVDNVLFLIEELLDVSRNLTGLKHGHFTCQLTSPA